MGRRGSMAAVFKAYILCILFWANSPELQAQHCVRRQEIARYDSTHVRSEAWYCGNKLDSIYTEWYRTGEIKEKGHYSNGAKVGTWEKCEYNSSTHTRGIKTFSEYKEGFLVEERSYEFVDSMQFLSSVKNYSYNDLSHDTVELERQFYPETGMMIQMDTLINGLPNGIWRFWDRDNGRLFGETYFKMGRQTLDKKYDTQNRTTVVHYFDNGWAKKDEFVYDCTGKLISEKHYDEKGKLTSEKKY